MNRSAPLDIQLTDDGSRTGVYVDSELVFEIWINDERLCARKGVVLTLRHGRLDELIIHPGRVDLPAELRPAAVAIPMARDMVTLVEDDLAGSGGPLAGGPVVGLFAVCSNSAGPGRSAATPDGGRVAASVSAPLAGPIVYTIPNAGAAVPGRIVDLEIDMVAPGSGRGEDEKGWVAVCSGRTTTTLSVIDVAR